MNRLLRLSAALAAVFCLASCGTAGHLLGRASNLTKSVVRPITAPVRGILLADESGAPALPAEDRDTADSPSDNTP